jgi:hypothetical protein
MLLWLLRALAVAAVAWLIWEIRHAPEVPAKRDGDKPWET